jgi:hypothetical protein
MESFSPGYRLQENDLNVTFFARGLTYPPDLTYSFSPYTLSYEINFIDSGSDIKRVGPLNRIPEKVNGSAYRANFIVGGDWATGIYQIVWKYKPYAYSDTQNITQQFEILSNGITSIPFINLYCRIDLPANFFVLPDIIDLPASFAIIP